MVLLAFLLLAPAMAFPAEGRTLNPCLQPDALTYFSLKPNCHARAWWTGHPYELRTNSLGLRDREPTAKGRKRRIVLLGSSELFGPGLNDDERVSRRFTEALHARTGNQYDVFNAGTEGFSTVQHLIRFDEKIQRRLEPDFIVYTLSTSTVFGNATQTIFTPGTLREPHLLFLPPALWNRLLPWPRLATGAFYALRELTEVGSAMRIRLRQWFAHDDTFEISARYLGELQRRCAAHGTKLLVVRYGTRNDFVLRVHFRKYSYPNWLRAFLDFLTPAVRLDPTGFEQTMKGAGVEHATFSDAERNRVFQDSFDNDLHANKDGAAEFGDILAEKFLAWQPVIASGPKRAGPGRR